MGLPGQITTKTATPRALLWSQLALAIVPGGKIIDGSKARDPLNTGALSELRAGLLLGKITSSGKYAPSIIGLAGEALDSDETALTVSTATATELVRRIGASGTFKLTGPPTASGVVRTVTVTYSAVDTSTGVITITAVGVSSTWTLTLTDGTDGGTFAVRVTNPAGVTQTIAGQAWNVSAANLETAIEALTIVGAGKGTVGLVGAVYTITFDEDLGDMQVEIVQDTTNDGGVFEGGVLAAQTAVGIDGRFVDASIIQPTDGSETILGLLPPLPDQVGIKVTDDDGNSRDTALPQLLIGGMIDASQIINYPSDASLKAWVKSELRASGVGYAFDDDF